LPDYVNPTWSNTAEGHIGSPPVPGRWLEPFRNAWPR